MPEEKWTPERLEQDEQHYADRLWKSQLGTSLRVVASINSSSGFWFGTAMTTSALAAFWPKIHSLPRGIPWLLALVSAGFAVASDHTTQPWEDRARLCEEMLLNHSVPSKARIQLYNREILGREDEQ